VNNPAAQRPEIKDIWSVVSPEAGETTETLMPTRPGSSESGSKPTSESKGSIAPVTSVIDERTGEEKTHPVNPSADQLTCEADKDEQEFIKGVGHVHSIV